MQENGLHINNFIQVPFQKRNFFLRGKTKQKLKPQPVKTLWGNNLFTKKWKQLGIWEMMGVCSKFFTHFSPRLSSKRLTWEILLVDSWSRTAKTSGDEGLLWQVTWLAFCCVDTVAAIQSDFCDTVRLGWVKRQKVVAIAGPVVA